VSAVADAARLVSFPLGATVIGAAGASFRRPGVQLTSAIQHLAAGVVFAAVAGEVLPDLRDQHSIGFLIGGFIAGVAVLLGLEKVAQRAEASGSTIPTGLVAMVAIDLAIDGLLVGMGAALGEGQGRILAIALTLEVLFLGLSVAAELAERGSTPGRSSAITAGVALALPIGAIGGAALLGGASHDVLAAVLAFGAAALLYLVTEELLVEAHGGKETPLLTAMFFVGFLAILVLEG
jgi:ZIP family zinc transporter